MLGVAVVSVVDLWLKQLLTALLPVFQQLSRVDVQFNIAGVVDDPVSHSHSHTLVTSRQCHELIRPCIGSVDRITPNKPFIVIHECATHLRIALHAMTLA